MKVMVTGHRPQGLGGYAPNPVQTWVKDKLDQTLREIKAKYPDVEVITGMALGVDQWWAYFAHAHGIPFHAYLPFDGQESRWPHKAQAEWQAILNTAKIQTTVCDGRYAAYKMQKRNEAMVDAASVCVAVWNGQTRGGTYNCIQYIIKSGKPLYVIDPVKHTRYWYQYPKE